MAVSTATAYRCQDCGAVKEWDGVHRCGEVPATAQAGVPYSLRARLLLALDAGHDTAASVASAIGVTSQTARAMLAEAEVAGYVQHYTGLTVDGRFAAQRWRLK